MEDRFCMSSREVKRVQIIHQVLDGRLRQVKADISTWEKSGHFYLVLTGVNLALVPRLRECYAPASIV